MNKLLDALGIASAYLSGGYWKGQKPSLADTLDIVNDALRDEASGQATRDRDRLLDRLRAILLSHPNDSENALRGYVRLQNELAEFASDEGWKK